jgi:hypothetical protein
MICRRGTYANPSVGIIAAGLRLFGRGRGHFCHLQSALPDHNARITIDIDRSIVRRVRVQYRKGSGSYTEVWGICSLGSAPRPDRNHRRAMQIAAVVAASAIAAGGGIEQISVQGTASIGPAEGQSRCRFFLQNVLILSPERPGRSGASCRPHLITLSGKSKEND